MKHKLLIAFALALMVPWAARAQSGCTPISTFPVTYGFETAEGFTDSVTAASNAPTSNTLGVCWRNEVTQGNTIGTRPTTLWCVNGSTTATFKHSGNKSLMLPDKGSSSSSSGVVKTMLAFPAMNFTNPGGYVVSFWMYRNGTGTNPEGFKVYASNTDTIGPNAVDLGLYSRHYTLPNPVVEPASGWYQYETAPITLTGTVYLIFEGQSYYGASTYVDDIVIMETPTCPRVSFLNVVPGSEDVLVSWTELGSASSWEVVISDATGIVSTNVVSDTTTTIYNLSPDTDYEVSVRAVCGVGDTSVAREVEFHTNCMDITSSVLPYIYDFDDASGNGASHSISYCWGRHCVGSTSNYPNPSSTNRHSGSYSLYMYNTSSIKSWATLPRLDATLPANTLSIGFWAYKASSAYGRLKVGVMTDPEDYSTFVAVDSFQVSTTSTWEYFEIPLTSYSGNGRYVAIMADSTSTNYSYVDDVVLLQTPLCSAPNSIEVTDITTNGFTLNIIDSANTGTYLVQVSGDTAFTETIYSTTYTFTDMPANAAFSLAVSAVCADGNPTSPVFAEFRTACLPISELPWTEGFEGIPVGSTSNPVFVPCMSRMNSSTSMYPYVSATSSYVHTGSQALYWYCPTTSGAYQYMVLPVVDTDAYAINTLQLRFWVRATSTSYNPVLQVGIMTDPNDRETFQPVQTINVGGNTTYTEYTVPFGLFEGYGQYVAIRATAGTASWYVTIDDMTLELMPNCPKIADLEVAATTVGSAMLTWDYQTGYDAPMGYELTYDVADGSNPTVLTFNESEALLSGLQAGTDYKVYLRADCGDTYGPFDSISFSTPQFACVQLDSSSMDTVNFSNSTSGQSGCMAFSTYGNTVYQTIYTAAELAAAGLEAGPITGIDLGFTGCTTNNKEFSIFIGNSSTTSITDASIEDPSQQQLVYGPAVHPMNTSGWQHYDFSVPFSWDGISSIIITTFMNQSGAAQTNSTGLTGYYVSASNKARYRYKDSSPFSLTDYNSGSAGSNYSYRAAIHFYSAECATLATCADPVLSVTDVTASSVTLSWVPGYDETAWDVDYRIVGASEWTNAATGVTDMTYTVDGLNSDRNYEFRVSFSCPGDDNRLYAATAMATTPCVAVSLPYSENFDNIRTTTTNSTSEYGLVPGCWNYVMTGTSTYTTGMYLPKVYYSTTYSNSGNYCLYLYGVGNIILPEINASLDSVTLSFVDYVSSSSYGLEVGVMEGDVFVPVQIVSSQLTANNFNLVEVNFSNYHGTSRTIALRNYYSTYSYSYHYIDDIYVEYTPSCLHVTDLEIDSVSSNTVSLSWTAAGEETMWSVSSDAGHYVTTYTPRVTLTDLASNTGYTFEVRALCSSDDSSRAMTVVARTSCDQYMTLPYSEDFETLTSSVTAGTGVHVPCWSEVMTGSSTYQGATYQPQVYFGTNSHSGNYCLRLYGVGYTVLQQLPIEADLVSMSFWSRHTSASYNLVVGLMSNPDSIETFDTVQVINYEGTSAPEYFEIDFSNYTGTGRYIAFRNTNTSATAYTSYHYIDDLEVWRTSTCATPASPLVSNISNHTATVSWIDTTGSYAGATIFWGTSSNRRFVTDSGSVTGSSRFNLTGLTGSTTYYVWVQGECNDEPSRAVMTSFTTTPDCMPVDNLTLASVGNHAFSLSWNAPAAGNTPSGYIVKWNKTGYDLEQVDTVTTTYYYVDGLEAATNYNYSVSTLCDSNVVDGEVRYLTTTLCSEETIGNHATNFSALPVAASAAYSYTQQIYLASELGSIDSISAISFLNPEYPYNRRNITVYMGNTSKSVFSGTTDFVPLANLTQVYSGPLEGFEWYTLHFSNTFVRQADSNLVIAVDDNTGTAYNSNVYFASSNLGDTTRSIYCYGAADITPANPSGSTYVSGYRNYIIVTPADCRMPDCDIPVLTFAASTDTSVSIQWNAEAGTTYTVEYRQRGEQDWTTFEASNTTGLSTINTLTPSEEWEIRVGFSCNGNMLYGTMNASTQCGVAVLPLAENFEGREFGDFVRPCWVVGQTRFDGTNVYPRVTRLTGSEDRLFFLYHGAYLIMPRVNAPLNELQLSFKLTQGGVGARLLLGVVANQSDPITSMIVLDTLIRSEYDSTTSTVNIAYSLENIDTAYNNYHLAFYDAFSDNYSFLNDIVLDYIPACTPPSGFAVDTVTPTSATISWTTNGENATGYYVVYGPRGFLVGSENSDTVAATASPFTINGLQHSTSYDAYVFTECNLISAHSALSQTIQFTTACAPVTALPYSMDFDHVMPAGNTTADVVPNCWVSESVDGGNRPRAYYTTTSDYTGSGNYCLYFSNTGVAALPEMGAPLNTLAISFRDYTPTPAAYGMVVGTVSSDADGFSSTFVPYDTLVYNYNTNVYNRTVYFSDYTGTNTRIAFKNVAAVGSTSTHYIDNVVVDVLPACIPPQNVHTTYLVSNEATLEWSRSNASNYTVIYGVHGTEATLTDNTSTRSITLTGLAPMTQYDVKVVGDCSTDTVLYTFTTPCNAVQLPYTENFDTLTTSTTAATGVQVPCWNHIMTGTATYQTTTYQPQVYYSATYANSGSYSLRLYGASYTMLPPMPTSLDSLQIVFNHYCTSASYALVVGAMEGSTFVPIDTIMTSETSVHTERIIPLSSYTGQSRIIAFRNYSTSSATTYTSYHYIDDLEVDYIPTCPKIANLNYVDATHNSVTLAWNTTGPESEWMVSNGTVDTLVTDSVATIFGLQPDSSYTFAVYPVCGPADTGRARYITVRTTCLPVTLPYTENFDSIRTTTTNTTEVYGLVPDCWSYIMTGTSTYQTGLYLPKVYYSTTYSNSGNYNLYIYGVGYHILPPMPTSLDSLELTFYDYATSATYGLQVGVMEGTTFIPVQTISTPASTHMQHTVYFGTYTGTSRVIAFRNYNLSSATTYTAGHYLDDIDVHYLPSCPRVLDVHAAGASTTSLRVDWIDQVPTTQWQVDYDTVPHEAGTGNLMTVNSHPVNITGLTELADCYVYVRPLCSATDTGDWSLCATLTTAMCDNATEFYTGAPTATSNQGPVNNFYKHTLSQTIIDSAELATLGEINYIGYSYSYATAMIKKTNVNIWLQPTDKTEFASNTDAVAVNPATAVKVYHGNLNCSQGWNYFALDTSYVWDGHSNLMVIVQDNSGDYDGSSYTFNVTAHTDYKYLVYYVDGTDTISAYNPATFTGTNRYRFQRRPTMKLISCGAPVCEAPAFTTNSVTETTATIRYSGLADNYEVAIIEGTWDDDAVTPVAVADTIYTFTGLTAATSYSVGVRAVCSPNNKSEWTLATVVTDEHPCFTPSALTVSDVTLTSATLGWTIGEAETEWELHVTGTNFDQTYTVTTNPYTLTGLTSGVEYSFTVTALCSATQRSEASEAQNFTTLTCQPVTGVEAGSITTSGATITWTAPEGVSNFEIEYGESGFTRGNGTTVTVNATSYAITGLDANMPYDVFVRSVCAAGVYSSWSDMVSFTTADQSGPIGIDDVDNASIALFPNPATTSVTLTGIDGQATVTIVDMNGREVYTQAIKQSNTQAITIDLTGYAQGAYFVRVTGEHQQAIRKLIVK